MCQRAFVLVSVFAGMAGAVVLSAQVTAKFKADHARLQTSARNLAIQKGAQDHFGCGLVQMYPDKGVIVDGNIMCGSNFHGGDPLKVTGTMERVR